MYRVLTGRRTIALGVMFIALSGCSSSSGTDGSNGGGESSCTITLSGAETGSPVCSGITAVWTTDDNQFLYGFFNNGGATTVIVSLGRSGEPTKTTYRNTDTDLIGSAVVQDGDNSWVAQSADTSSDTQAAGSFAVTITSVSTTVSTSDGKVYALHGTFTATLPPAAGTGSTGTVTMNVKF
jgi:hypothetical protein